MNPYIEVQKCSICKRNADEINKKFQPRCSKHGDTIVKVKILLTGGNEMSWKCEGCGREITKKDEYIKYDGKRFCSDCYQADTSTSYFISGEYLANDGDGVVEYGLWSLEEKLYYVKEKEENGGLYILSVEIGGNGSYDYRCESSPVKQIAPSFSKETAEVIAFLIDGQIEEVIDLI